LYDCYTTVVSNFLHINIKIKLILGKPQMKQRKTEWMKYERPLKWSLQNFFQRFGRTFI